MDATQFDEGLFQHEPAGQNLHLMREVLLTFPGRGLVARYTADGRISGVRGAALWDL